MSIFPSIPIQGLLEVKADIFQINQVEPHLLLTKVQSIYQVTLGFLLRY